MVGFQLHKVTVHIGLQGGSSDQVGGIQFFQIQRRQEFVVFVEGGALRLFQLLGELLKESAPLWCWPKRWQEICSDLFLLLRGKDNPRAILRNFNIVNLILRFNVSKKRCIILIPNFDNLFISC